MKKYWLSTDGIIEDDIKTETKEYFHYTDGTYAKKTSICVKLFDTAKEAKQALIDEAREKMESAQMDVERLRGELHKAMAIDISQFGE